MDQNDNNQTTNKDKSNDNISDSKLEKPKKKKKKRCLVCNKKLGLMPFQCKCGLEFCSFHVQPETHNCKYDYCNHGKNLLSSKLIKVDSIKIDPI